jgi:predicted nucleotide-binding protein
LKGLPAVGESDREKRRETALVSREQEAVIVPTSPPMSNDPTPLVPTVTVNRRIFITHGKNKAFLEPIRKLLGLIEMIPVVSAERQSVAKPVPDKVMDDMRSCGAAIIHIDEETTLVDKNGNEHTILNDNVLMEAWGALALYGRRFVLLVKAGIKLPSNLQGLYEVRYSGDLLDSDATLRLLEAINDIKNNPTPRQHDAA